MRPNDAHMRIRGTHRRLRVVRFGPSAKHAPRGGQTGSRRRQGASSEPEAFCVCCVRRVRPWLPGLAWKVTFNASSRGAVPLARRATWPCRARGFSAEMQSLSRSADRPVRMFRIERHRGYSGRGPTLPLPWEISCRRRWLQCWKSQ